MYGLRMFAPAAAVVTLLGSAAVVRAEPPEGFPAITSEQRAKIMEQVRAERHPSIASSGSFTAAAGGTLPLGIELFWMAPGVQLNHYRYTVVDEHTVVVVPYTRRIVEILD
jgi:Protein of unknown function (DUF1236)